MHRLSHLVIKNFRACRDVSLPLESYTPLVGQNNAGKSTILQAIGWVLKPGALATADFFDAEQPVEIAACIEGINEEVLARIPEEKHRQAIEPYCREGRLWIRVVATGPSTKAITKEVWDIAQCLDTGLPSHWRAYPTGLPQAVSVLLPEPLVIQAMHDIGEDLGKAKAGTTIKALLDEIMVPVLEAHADLSHALDTIRQILTAGGNNRSAHLQQFDNDATASLAHFFPGLSLDLDLQVIDLKEFFKAGDLHVTDNMIGDRRRFDQMGTGAQRAIQMALIRHLAGTRAGDVRRPSRRLLLIDEPELYLHPQGVRRLRQALASLAEAGFQVVFATHSPLMLSRENTADIVIVGKKPDRGVTTQKPLRQAVDEALNNAESQSRALFELGNLADIYFAERVVLCEGKTDRRLLPLAYERLYGTPPELDHVAFVSLGSCADIPKALPVLAAMGIKACAVVDLDFCYTHARSGGLLGKDAEDLSDAKARLARMQPDHGFTLSGNGLPQNDKQKGWMAADVWAQFAADDEGRTIAERSHEALKANGVWAWTQGCIEQVTNTVDKGEEAIIEQEQLLRAMAAADIEQQVPAFKACFDWIRSL
ncbi:MULTISPECIES: ATP-dependent endonuclease [unclassified Pseudomonas]|uniref:ATP-dependent nuclease n=1 Tax=unclassified Pseudomonas TaxID=196821 RepID=UPI0002A2F49D|nr:MULTISPECIES: AAA family ATPase [unclassified Pseudomonas]MBB1605150.1 AAA family ATPase [Pseudomonas sp. UMC76]MBB1641987.1 AAA family ATPase [Pseudomonas sp. UME83]NTX92660.1 AAA family ATPase [Pseudomonas sp. UMA643]NTY21898.1 AAA family ATPase [Pseudomonas sp. UMC3103]NTY28025.1 AAA family ATPase [Pseudomonas sp. UMA603]